MTESLRILIRVSENGIIKTGVTDAIRLHNGLRVIMEAAYAEGEPDEIATRTFDIMDADSVAAPDGHPDYEYSTHLVYDADAPLPPVQNIYEADIPEGFRFRPLSNPSEQNP